MRQMFGEAPVLETEEVRVLRENIWVPSRLWEVNLVLDTSSLEVNRGSCHLFTPDVALHSRQAQCLYQGQPWMMKAMLEGENQTKRHCATTEKKHFRGRKKHCHHGICLSLGSLSSLQVSALIRSGTGCRKYCVNSKLHTSHIIWDEFRKIFPPVLCKNELNTS